MMKKLKTLTVINDNFEKISINKNDLDSNLDLKNENINKITLLIKNQDKKAKKSHLCSNFVNNTDNIVKMNHNKHHYYF